MAGQQAGAPSASSGVTSMDAANSPLSSNMSGITSAMSSTGTTTPPAGGSKGTGSGVPPPADSTQYQNTFNPGSARDASSSLATSSTAQPAGGK